MPTFASVDDLAIYTRQTFTGDDLTAATLSLDLATGLIQSYTGRILFETVGDVVTLTPKSGVVLLPNLPVTAVTSVVDAEGEPVEFTLQPAGVLHLESWSGPVTVTYSHGYTVIPQDLRMVCLAIAARASGSSSSSSGVKSESIGSYSVTYADDRQTGIYPDGADMAILDRYRLPSMA